MKNYVQKLLLVFVAMVFFTGCTINTTVKGKVSNTQSQALEGAKVTISYSKANYETTTDPEGNYSITGKLPITEDSIITVSKDGYKTAKNSFLISYEYSNKIFNYDVVLQADEPDVIIEYGSISGVVKDIVGNVISDATVSIGSQIVTTDAQGVYSLSDVQVTDKLSVTITKDGYGLNSNVIAVKKDEISTLDFVLIENDITVKFNSAVNNIISVKDAKINFNANSFILENGNTYSGEVTVVASFHQPTSLIGRLAFPGEYQGTRSDGSTTLLQSYGFFNVELFAQDGSRLNLASGSTATLIYPADINLSHTDETMPLWYYDTILGTWVEDGFATYDEVNNVYVGTVSHFTAWNLDKPYPRATANCNVVDKNGLAVSNANITTIAASYFYQNIVTDSLGQCSIVVPANLPFILSASKANDIGVSTSYTLTPMGTANITIVLETYDSTDYKDIMLTGNILVNNNYSNKDINTTINNLTTGSTYYTYTENISSNVEIKVIDETKISIEIYAYTSDWSATATTVPYATYRKVIEVNIPAAFSENTLNLGTILLGESDIIDSGEYLNEIIDCEDLNNDGLCIPLPMPQ